MTDLKSYKMPPMFTDCDFADTIMPDGTVLRTDGEPILLERGNIIFPTGWTRHQCESFREEQKRHSR